MPQTPNRGAPPNKLPNIWVRSSTVYRWRKSKGMPAHRIGRLWKFKVSKVDGWVRTGGAEENQGRD